MHVPEALDEGLRMKGPGGLETALLLVRRTPLPSNIDLAAVGRAHVPVPAAQRARGRRAGR